ncbi:hypothetical protein [Bacillus subtilis]|uniref:hypothetical protein n=1 Tax=Bacillus subtilis TaxID=1423 RepID=UPI00165AE336|nr:hypothetical protein [Bacillus subtilis]MCY8199770.1 hypothetical protein [Bacillus subtilis]MEC1443688.1 hypothetical protein [Bacillus subtilis]MED2967434.1 hypothetical protein [Bacillus subtilis]
MEEKKSNEMDLETKAELFERKAAAYRQNWMDAEDVVLSYQRRNKKAASPPLIFSDDLVLLDLSSCSGSFLTSQYVP